MCYWSADYSTEKLPTRLTKNGVSYNLQITSGAFRYILNYVGWDNPYEDRPTTAIQAYGNTEEQAVEMMVGKLKELGIELER